MQSLWFRRILLAALAVVLIAGTAAAQVRPAYVKNVDEPGRAPYQQMVNFSLGFPTTCDLAMCVISFNAVPAGKRLIVEHVTMLAYVRDGRPMFLAFGENAVINRDNIAIVGGGFTDTGIESGVGNRWFTLDRAVKVCYEAGTIPKLKLRYSGSLGLGSSNASLHGYLIDANN
jgi:hypothetical protein